MVYCLRTGVSSPFELNLLACVVSHCMPHFTSSSSATIRNYYVRRAFYEMALGMIPLRRYIRLSRVFLGLLC